MTDHPDATVFFSLAFVSAVSQCRARSQCIASSDEEKFYSSQEKRFMRTLCACRFQDWIVFMLNDNYSKLPADDRNSSCRHVEQIRRFVCQERNFESDTAKLCFARSTFFFRFHWLLFYYALLRIITWSKNSTNNNEVVLTIYDWRWDVMSLEIFGKDGKLFTLSLPDAFRRWKKSLEVNINSWMQSCETVIRYSWQTELQTYSHPVGFFHTCFTSSPHKQEEQPHWPNFVCRHTTHIKMSFFLLLLPRFLSA